MSIGTSQDHVLIVKFGKDNISLDPTSMQECIIVKDIRKFLPEFKMVMYDTQGIFTHVKTFDSAMSRVSFEVSSSLESSNVNSYDFLVYRRTPTSIRGSIGMYEINGMLNIDNLFYPQYIRSFNGTVKETLETIGSELKVTDYDISSSLNFNKTILQPNWTNAQLLNHLASSIEGNGGKSNYRTFIKVEKNKKILVFKTLEDFIKSTLAGRYIMSDNPYEDYQPCFSYEIIDNYKYLGVLGCRSQAYTYFNYDTGTFTSGSKSISTVLSLSDYFAVDGNDPDEGLSYNETGRSNGYTSNFSGVVSSIYESRINELVKMWITTTGDVSMECGDIIRVLFPQGMADGNLFSYQYSGDWMVERVVLSFAGSFRMHLLLTRGGVDSDQKNTLIKPTLKRKS